MDYSRESIEANRTALGMVLALEHDDPQGFRVLYEDAADRYAVALALTSQCAALATELGQARHITTDAVLDRMTRTWATEESDD